MTYFVLWWSKESYIPVSVEEFETEVDWLNKHVAGHGDISFQVIEGKELKFASKEVTTKFARQR